MAVLRVTACHGVQKCTLCLAFACRMVEVCCAQKVGWGWCVLKSVSVAVKGCTLFRSVCHGHACVPSVGGHQRVHSDSLEVAASRVGGSAWGMGPLLFSVIFYFS